MSVKSVIGNGVGSQSNTSMIMRGGSHSSRPSFIYK